MWIFLKILYSTISAYYFIIEKIVWFFVITDNRERGWPFVIALRHARRACEGFLDVLYIGALAQKRFCFRVEFAMVSRAAEFDSGDAHVRGVERGDGIVSEELREVGKVV